MGRKRKPTHLHLINGNPGKRPLPAGEPIPVGNLHEPPAWLTESQKGAWRYAIEHAPHGLLKQVDRGVLTIWIVAEDLHREASIKVAEHGMLVRTPNTGEPQQSPYMPIVNRQAVLMMRAATELGFSPCARPAIDAPPSGNAFANNGHGRRPPPDGGDSPGAA